jgi:hypothetical protein
VTCEDAVLFGAVALPAPTNSEGSTTAITGESVAARQTAVGPRLLDLVPSFTRHVRAENKAPRTMEASEEAVRRLHESLTAAGMPIVVASNARDSRRGVPVRPPAGLTRQPARVTALGGR